MRVRLNSNHRGAGKAPRRLVLRGNPAPAGGQAEDESDEGGKRPGESESHGNQGEGNVEKRGRIQTNSKDEAGKQTGQSHGKQRTPAGNSRGRHTNGPQTRKRCLISFMIQQRELKRGDGISLLVRGHPCRETGPGAPLGGARAGGPWRGEAATCAGIIERAPSGPMTRPRELILQPHCHTRTRHGS